MDLLPLFVGFFPVPYFGSRLPLHPDPPFSDSLKSQYPPFLQLLSPVSVPLLD